MSDGPHAVGADAALARVGDHGAVAAQHGQRDLWSVVRRFVFAVLRSRSQTSYWNRSTSLPLATTARLAVPSNALESSVSPRRRAAAASLRICPSASRIQSESSRGRG